MQHKLYEACAGRLPQILTAFTVSGFLSQTSTLVPISCAAVEGKTFPHDDTSRTNTLLEKKETTSNTVRDAAITAAAAGTSRSALLVFGFQGIDNWRTRAQAGGITGRAVWREAVAKDGIMDLMYKGVLPNATRTFSRECFRGGLLVFADQYMRNPILKAGALTAGDVLFMPLERAKVLANTTGESYAKSCIAAARSGSMADIKSVIASGYQGSIAMAARQGARWGMFFAVDDTIKSFFKQRAGGEPLSLADKIMAACVTGVFTGVVPIPADVVKTRMQAQAEGISKGVLQVIKEIWAKEGIQGFGRAGLPKFLLTSVPSIINSIIRSTSIEHLLTRLDITPEEWGASIEKHSKTTVMVEGFGGHPTPLDHISAPEEVAAVSTYRPPSKEDTASVMVEDFIGDMTCLTDIIVSLKDTDERTHGDIKRHSERAEPYSFAEAEKARINKGEVTGRSHGA